MPLWGGAQVSEDVAGGSHLIARSLLIFAQEDEAGSSSSVPVSCCVLLLRSLIRQLGAAARSQLNHPSNGGRDIERQCLPLVCQEVQVCYTRLCANVNQLRPNWLSLQAVLQQRLPTAQGVCAQALWADSRRRQKHDGHHYAVRLSGVRGTFHEGLLQMRIELGGL